MIIRIAIVAAVVFAWAMSAPAVGADYMRVPGTHIELIPPEGFSPSDKFPGFLRADATASIEVTEIPGPFPEVRAGLESKERLEQQGMTLVGLEHPSIAGTVGVLARLTQTEKGVTQLKASFGDEKHSAVVAGTFFSDEPEASRKLIHDALLTARWSGGPEPGVFEGLNFRITESATLQIWQRISTSLLLAPPGSKAPIPHDAPTLIVASSPEAPEEAQFEDYAKQAMLQTKSLTNVHNIKSSATRVENLPAFELTADAQQSGDATPVRLYELMVGDFPAKRCYFAFGMAPGANTEKAMADFKTVARSLKIER